MEEQTTFEKEKILEEYLEGLDIIQLRALQDELKVKKDNDVARYQGGDKSALVDVQRTLYVLQKVNALIFNIEHADEIKAEEERQAKEQAEREKALKAEQERQAKIKAERELKRQAEEQEKLEKKVRAKEKWIESESKMKNKFERLADAIIDALKVQVVPSTECVEMNDKLVKLLFNYNDDWFKRLMNGATLGIIEKRAHINKKGKKKEKIVSKYTLRNAEGYDDETPLDEFDRAVLGVIFSEVAIGNRHLTVNIIFRALIGQVGNQNVRPSKNQRDAIVKSVLKLMSKIANFSSMSETLTELNYTDKDGNELKFGYGTLLSADIVDAKINGQVMEGVIYLKGDSPLFAFADAKSQIIRYPHELLNVPNLNNTPRIIALKKYVMRRICEIKLHKQLVPTITFADVFKKCRMENSPRKTKMDARNAIQKLFEHLKENNFITDFELVKNPQTQKFISVKFSY